MDMMEIRNDRSIPHSILTILFVLSNLEQLKDWTGLTG
jgi:hypothetical protein